MDNLTALRETLNTPATEDYIIDYASFVRVCEEAGRKPEDVPHIKINEETVEFGHRATIKHNNAQWDWWRRKLV